MSIHGRTILVVDDDAPLRHSLSIVLSSLGYRVRVAEDGFAALAALRLEIPDAILSDLFMPGMSGFELLSVIRRRFPAIQVIAMSGSHIEPETLSGTAADAFHEKGEGLTTLIKKLEVILETAGTTRLRSHGKSPVWVARTAFDDGSRSQVTLACPECLRTFTQPLAHAGGKIHHADCVHCKSVVAYALVHSSTSFQRFMGMPSDPLTS